MKTPQARLEQESATLRLQDWRDFSRFSQDVRALAGIDASALAGVRRLVVGGSEIDGFAFLARLPGLQALSFLACQSARWQELSDPGAVTSLRLHNLKEGKRYLHDAAFLSRFQNLRCLYLNMLGLPAFPDLFGLTQLHTVAGSFRNENDIRAPYRFDALEQLPGLRVFFCWAAVDRHRIPAQSLLPVLKNPGLTSVGVAQMFPAEDKRLHKLIGETRPALLETSLPEEALRELLATRFAW